MRTALVWLRRDLRIDDNDALLAALDAKYAVVPVYIWAPEEEGAWPPGAATRWWLHHALVAFQAALEKRGSTVVIRRGPSQETLQSLVRETNAEAVYWNRCYDPAARDRDGAIKAALREDGVAVESYNASLLLEPPRFANKQGDPYKVFTPFYRAAAGAIEVAEPRSAPKKLRAPDTWPTSESVAALELLPTIRWDAGLAATWTPGAAGAGRALDAFGEEAIVDYGDARDWPSQRGTSRLSPHLHFGEIGPRQVYHGIRERAFAHHGPSGVEKAEPYIRQLFWRDFAHYMLYHFPHTESEPLQESFAKFPWVRNKKALRAWQQGETGYPMVDAGMRELYETGWMHNRVRMVVASFLVKHLRLHWIEGATWFWDTLVDADLANNTLGWQWAAGCGADAAPYFRIFNPMTQGERFDKKAGYVRRWCPELARLPDKHIHTPWEAPKALLAHAGVELGQTYPAPIVDHKTARQAALDAFAAMRDAR